MNPIRFPFKSFKEDTGEFGIVTNAMSDTVCAFPLMILMSAPLWAAVTTAAKDGSP